MVKPLEPMIDTTNINEKAYDFIKRRIIRLTYAPGDKIDVKRLQTELAISQTPIKDALYRLAGEGMVEISSRRGSYVKDVTERDLVELLQTRIILETAAVDIIGTRLSEEQLKELEFAYKETLQQGPDFSYELFMEKDSAFHTKFIEFTGNRKLMGIYEHLGGHMQAVRFRLAHRHKGKLPWVDEDHKRILAALKERRPGRAKEAIRKHITKAAEAFLREEDEGLNGARGGIRTRSRESRFWQGTDPLG